MRPARTARPVRRRTAQPVLTGQLDDLRRRRGRARPSRRRRAPARGRSAGRPAVGPRRPRPRGARAWPLVAGGSPALAELAHHAVVARPRRPRRCGPARPAPARCRARRTAAPRCRRGRARRSGTRELVDQGHHRAAVSARSAVGPSGGVRREVQHGHSGGAARPIGTATRRTGCHSAGVTTTPAARRPRSATASASGAG